MFAQLQRPTRGHLRGWRCNDVPNRLGMCRERPDGWARFTPELQSQKLETEPQNGSSDNPILSLFV